MREVSFPQNFWSPGQLRQAAVQPLKQAHSVLHMIAVFGRQNPWSLDQLHSWQAATQSLFCFPSVLHMTAASGPRNLWNLDQAPSQATVAPLNQARSVL